MPVKFTFQQYQDSSVGSAEFPLIIGPAPFELQRTKARAKSAAGPSTTFGAKNAPNSAQDDSFVGGAIPWGRINMKAFLPDLLGKLLCPEIRAEIWPRSSAQLLLQEHNATRRSRQISGKADPANPASKTAIEQGDKLSGRLNEHRKNIIRAASTLRLEDFEYRALVVQTGWQNAAESYLIDLFKPIWNNEVGLCYGFGKHGDAPETRANLRSPWDTLHYGRDWAHRDPNMADARPKARIVKDIARHFVEHPPFVSVDKILRLFLEEMRGGA
jgi:hypothetical protein